LLIVAPPVLGFADGGPAQWTAQMVGALTIIVSLLTDYPLGARRLVPFRIHLVLDVAMGVLLAASPWLFGFAERIWWPHMLVGIIYIVAPFLTRRT
jgi:hypothetical protein